MSGGFPRDYRELRFKNTIIPQLEREREREREGERERERERGRERERESSWSA